MKQIINNKKFVINHSDFFFLKISFGMKPENLIKYDNIIKSYKY